MQNSGPKMHLKLGTFLSFSINQAFRNGGEIPWAVQQMNSLDISPLTKILFICGLYFPNHHVITIIAYQTCIQIET